MRIVHINTEPTWRGGESQVFNLMRGLRQAGHEVEAVALPDGMLAARCREESIPVLGLEMRSDLDLRAAWRLGRYLRRHPCDIMNAQTARAHSIALLSRAMGAPGRLVVTRRLDFPIRRHPANLWKYRHRGVDRYIAVAGVIRDILVGAGVEPERVTVINSSIDLSRFQDVGDERDEVRRSLGLPRDAFVIGNVAALAWHKGQRDLVEAIPAVVDAIPDARCVIVGGGDERGALERQVARAGLGDRIVLTGARRDVPRLLSSFDLFCMPSYYEGLCNSVLEAFAMKLPVVATRAGGLPEIVSEEVTGLLVPPKDPPALAAGIVRLARDTSLARRVADAGHRLVHEGFGVDLMVSRTEALYLELTGGLEERRSDMRSEV